MGESAYVSLDSDVLSRYRIAVVQMDSTAYKEENLRVASSCIDEAASAGAKVICFPEGMNQIEVPIDPSDFERVPGYTTDLLANKAREYGIYIHCGSLHERIEDDVRAFNTSVVVSPEGEVIAQYRKLHAFDVALSDGTSCAESERFKPGDSITVVKTPLGTWGCAICYDIRFPELFRMMVLQGAQVIFVPANFTQTTGRDHWETLLRTRAIENGCFVVAANQCGIKPEFTAYGHSMIVDPWGNVLAEANGDTPEIIYAHIDLESIEDVRSQLPCLANRRADVYGTFGLE